MHMPSENIPQDSNARDALYFEHCVFESPRVRNDEEIFRASSPILEPSTLHFGAFWMNKGDNRLRLELARLWHGAAREGAPIAFRPDDSIALIRESAEDMVDRAESGEVHLLLFYWSGEIAGSLVLQTEPGVLPTSHGVLSRIVVRKDLQRRGLGTSLLEIGADRARRMGLNALFLTVRDKSGLANFYSRRGWVVVGRWQDGIKLDDDLFHDELIMQRMA